MQGTECLSALTQDALGKILATLYPVKFYDPGLMEDLILATSDRSMYPNIGTDKISLRCLKYVLDNAWWISVCMFVNDDFRSCFDDAIMIEKALLQVNDKEYEDFRDDMTLPSDTAEPDKFVSVRLDSYSEAMERSLLSMLGVSRKAFTKAGMNEAYAELLDTMDRKARTETASIVHNLLYVLNAMNYNGVFKKYVTLVVDSVKKQLS